VSFEDSSRQGKKSSLAFCYGRPATFRLCTPERIDVAVLMDCGAHHVRRNTVYWLRYMCRASRSNSTGPTCNAG